MKLEISTYDSLHFNHVNLQPAKAIMDPMQRKRLENSNGETAPIVRKTCLEATAPLAHLPYEEQLLKKENELKDILSDYRKQIVKVNPKLGSVPDIGIWSGFERAPLINGYRNKSEFTVGKNANGEKLVGFRLGSYADGSVEVGDISDLPHIPDRMKLAAKLCQDFIRASSYDVFSPEFYTGVFRQVSVRYSTVTDELMLILGLHIEVGCRIFNLTVGLVLRNFIDAHRTSKTNSLVKLFHSSRKPEGKN